MRKRIVDPYVFAGVLISNLVYVSLSNGKYTLFGIFFSLIGLALGRTLRSAFAGKENFASPNKLSLEDDLVLLYDDLPAVGTLRDPFAYFGLDDPGENLAEHEVDRDVHSLDFLE